MPTAAATSGRPVPVQRFAPTNGPVVGYAAAAMVVLVLGFVVVGERSVLGLQVVLGGLLLLVVIWTVLLRPRAAAYADTLVLRHALSDTHLPLTGIDTVMVRQTLNVWVGDRRYVCSGIGRSVRSMARGRRPVPSPAQEGFGRPVATQPRGPAQAAVERDYPTFVETRIEDLVRQARRERPDGGGPVQRRWAWPEIAALTATALAFAGSLLL